MIQKTGFMSDRMSTTRLTYEFAAPTHGSKGIRKANGAAPLQSLDYPKRLGQQGSSIWPTDPENEKKEKIVEGELTIVWPSQCNGVGMAGAEGA
ncbi:hypothetical protein V496_00752 [Pseudogymnoascus sp. VKM F-4515 (FW-2607)]|nr:hypothetical protein V496_00752 [Pseudogymnoascus sp. VKM F-4515 (FW-2607)]